MKYCIYSNTESPDVTIPVELTYFDRNSEARNVPASGTPGSSTFKPGFTTPYYCRNNAIELGGTLYRNKGIQLFPSIDSFTDISTTGLVTVPLGISPGFSTKTKILAHPAAYGRIPLSVINTLISSGYGGVIPPNFPDDDYSMLDGVLLNIAEIVDNPTGDLVVTVETKAWDNLPKVIPAGYTVLDYYPDKGAIITYRFYYPLSSFFKGSTRKTSPDFLPNAPFRSKLSAYWVYLKFPPNTLVYNENTYKDWYGNSPSVVSTAVPKIFYRGAKQGSYASISFSTFPNLNQARIVVVNRTKVPNAIVFKTYNRRSNDQADPNRVHLPFNFYKTFDKAFMSNDVDLHLSQLVVAGSYLPYKRYQKGMPFKPSSETIPMSPETITNNIYQAETIPYETYQPYVNHSVELTKEDTTAAEESRTFPMNSIMVAARGSCKITSPFAYSTFNFFNKRTIDVFSFANLTIQCDIILNIPSGYIAVHDLGSAILSGSPVLPYFYVSDNLTQRQTVSGITLPANSGWLSEDWVQLPYVNTDLVVTGVNLNYFNPNFTTTIRDTIAKSISATGVGYIKALPTYSLQRRKPIDCFISSIDVNNVAYFYNKPLTQPTAGMWSYNSVSDYELDPICNYTRRFIINNNDGSSAATYNGCFAGAAAARESNYSTRTSRGAASSAVGDCYISVGGRGTLTAHNVQINMFGGVYNTLGNTLGTFNLSSSGAVSITGCSILNTHRTPAPAITTTSTLSGGERVVQSAYLRSPNVIYGAPLSSETLYGVYATAAINIDNPTACNYYISKNIIHTASVIDIYLSGVQPSTTTLTSAVVDNVIYNSINIGMKIEDTLTTTITGNKIYNTGNAATIVLTAISAKSLTSTWPYEFNSAIVLDRTQRRYLPQQVRIADRIRDNAACYNNNIGMYTRHVIGKISSDRLSYNVNYGLLSMSLTRDVPVIIDRVFSSDNNIGVGVLGDDADVNTVSATNITAFNNITHGIYINGCNTNIVSSVCLYNGRGVATSAEGFGVYSTALSGAGAGIYVDKCYVGDVNIESTSCFHNNIVKRSGANAVDDYKEQIILDASANNFISYSDLHIRDCNIGRVEPNARIGIGPILTLNSFETCTLSSCSPYNSSSLTLNDKYGIGLIRPR